MSGLLERMAVASRERAARARDSQSEAALRARARASEDPPALKLDRFDIIAELKLRSPAMGDLAAPDFDFAAQLGAYSAGGAAAVSVLTEPDEFRGSLADLEQAAGLLRPHGIPVMRKDFLTEPYQILEARAAGAGGVLVIAAMLNDAALAALVDCAGEYGLFVLLEAFDRPDLERIAQLAARQPARPEAPLLAGVNSRNLRTLEVDFGRFASLVAQLPAGLPAIAESGIESADQLLEIAELGYAGALVGAALMQSAAPEEQLGRWIAMGREVRRTGRGTACS